MLHLSAQAHPGRGAVRDLPNRFEALALDLDPDVVQPDPDLAGQALPSPQTRFYDDLTQTVLTRNESPDLGFGLGLNPYRGCEHGCAYCYARPYHEYLGFSAGLEFESKIMVKRRAPELLRRELSAPRYRPEPLTISGVTDCYQPAERQFRVTRGCLEVLAEFRHPVVIITKNYLVTRDLDLLVELARYEAVEVFISLTTLDQDLAAKMEPRASAPKHRLRAIERLAAAGVPVGVMTAPIIPGMNDREIPALLEAARTAGAIDAGYTILRLPHGVKEVFVDWLKLHFPGRVERVLGTIRGVRQGQLNSSRFGERLRGSGPYADQIHQLFHTFRERLGYRTREQRQLGCAHFRPPGAAQLSLALA